MRKIFDFHGGVHPPENKTQSTQSAIGHIPLASHLILPLNQHIGAPALAIVQVGDNVLKNQLIAQAQGFVSANIHAPTSGVVSAIEERVSNHASGLLTLSIVLETDGKDESIALDAHTNPFDLSPEAIIAKVHDAGITGMGGAGFPTAVKLSGSNIDTLILNAAECEPYITADDMLLRTHSDEVIAGACLLAQALPSVKHVLIGIEDNKPEAIQALNDACSKQAHSAVEIEIVSLPTKYPSGGEKQLIKLLTGKEVPAGNIPASIGIVMQNVGTCRAVWRAVRYGEALTSRITTVVGEALAKQGNIELPLGTPISHILEQQGYQVENNERVVIGGPMMGWAIDNTDAPLLKATNCILAPSKNEVAQNAAEQACIRCGMCAEACPAELLPQQLYWYARAEDNDKLKAYNIMDCIECGACSYVCPSNIPLVQYYRAGKGAIRLAEQEKQKSDQARLRFEARQQRIEKEEAEKAAKRAERKAAAEAAKKKLAEKAAASTADVKADEGDMKKIKSALVEDALKNAKAATAPDPEKEKARLTRSLSSAESRLERAKASLQKNTDEGAEEARLSALAARVKEAEQKVLDARKKLEEANL